MTRTLSMRHAEARRDALRDHGFGALALLADAGVAEDRAGGVEPDRRAILRGNARAADAVERRRRVGHLDEGGKADAAIDALFRANAPARREGRRSSSSSRDARAPRGSTAPRI